MLYKLLARAVVVLQLQRELDVIREGARLVVVERVVEDRPDLRITSLHARSHVTGTMTRPPRPLRGRPEATAPPRAGQCGRSRATR